MANSALASVLRYLGRLARTGEADEPGDGQLLRQFVARRHPTPAATFSSSEVNEERR